MSKCTMQLHYNILYILINDISQLFNPQKRNNFRETISYGSPLKKNKILKFSASLLFLPVAFNEGPFGRTSVGCHLAWKIGLDVPVGPGWSKCTCYIDTYKKLFLFNVHKYILHESRSIIQPILVPIRYVINILSSISNKEKKTTTTGTSQASIGFNLFLGDFHPFQTKCLRIQLGVN